MNNMIDYYRKQGENEELNSQDRSNFIMAMWAHVKQLTTRYPLVVYEEPDDR